MGQEASLPQSSDTSLEEQGRAPPSSSNLPSGSTGRSGRKLMGARFRGNQQNDNFEQREAARAAAAGGNLYLADRSSSELFAPTANGEAYTANTQQSLLLVEDQTNGASRGQRPLQPPTPRQQAEYYDQSQQQQQHAESEDHPVVGIMYEKTSPSPRKGIFAGKPTGRGASIINSMRNLSLGGALRTKKAGGEPVNDWEKQWDEDEDDSSEEEEDQVNDDQKMPQVPSNGLLAQQLASPSTAVPPPTAHLVSVDATAPLARINKALRTAPDDGLEWDTAAGKAGEDGKPNVQMFMPMLRVLGKGSFGKVSSCCDRVYCRRCYVRTRRTCTSPHGLAFELSPNMRNPSFRNNLLAYSPTLSTKGCAGPKTSRERTRPVICHENTAKNTSRETTTD